MLPSACSTRAQVGVELAAVGGGDRGSPSRSRSRARPANRARRPVRSSRASSGDPVTGSWPCSARATTSRSSASCARRFGCSAAEADHPSSALRLSGTRRASLSSALRTARGPRNSWLASITNVRSRRRASPGGRASSSAWRQAARPRRRWEAREAAIRVRPFRSPRHVGASTRSAAALSRNGYKARYRREQERTDAAGGEQQRAPVAERAVAVAERCADDDNEGAALSMHGNREHAHPPYESCDRGTVR